MSISDATARRMAILPLLQALLGRHYFLFLLCISCFRLPGGGMRHGNEIGDEAYATGKVLEYMLLYTNI